MDAGSRGNPCRGFFNMVSVFGFGVPYKCDALYFWDQLRTPKKRKRTKHAGSLNNHARASQLANQRFGVGIVSAARPHVGRFLMERLLACPREAGAALVCSPKQPLKPLFFQHGLGLCASPKTPKSSTRLFCYSRVEGPRPQRPILLNLYASLKRTLTGTATHTSPRKATPRAKPPREHWPSSSAHPRKPTAGF